ncbi:MAG: hypothetical protein K9G62_04860 [Alphaproteobacteria bacterium]|nr:hypothetical protein [Alphaproteobacteria bacterium]
MFSALGNIFPELLRRVENVDTRLDIRRHDPDQEGRRGKDDHAPEDSSEPEDRATMSLEALGLFLENFIKTLETKSPSGHTDSSSSMPESMAVPRASSSRAARAAQAYQHAAEATAPSGSLESPVLEESPPALESEEIRALYSILVDVKLLRERGVDVLTIERSDTFLNSLRSAVDKALEDRPL